MLWIKSQWEIFILVINGRICIAENGSQVHGQHFSIFHGRFLIVYSSFGRVYRELLTCLKCSSHSNSFCSPFSLFVRLPPSQRGELKKHLQPGKVEHWEVPVALLLTSRWRGQMMTPARLRLTIDEHRTFFSCFFSVFVHVSSLTSCLLLRRGYRNSPNVHKQ